LCQRFCISPLGAVARKTPRRCRPSRPHRGRRLPCPRSPPRWAAPTTCVLNAGPTSARTARALLWDSTRPGRLSLHTRRPPSGRRSRCRVTLAGQATRIPFPASNSAIDSASALRRWRAAQKMGGVNRPVARKDVDSVGDFHHLTRRVYAIVYSKRPKSGSVAHRQHGLHAHSITSSARARRVGGTVRPSALAVLRLIAISNFIGCCTGSSAGFSPLRMRST
jgi:hypothetical protein